MQHKITKPSCLLAKNGILKQRGYATRPILKYNRNRVAFNSRLKEWDYYLIQNKRYEIALTIGRSLSLLLISASVIDLVNKKETTKSIVRIVPKDMFSMPLSSESGNLHYKDDEVNVSFLCKDGIRNLSLFIKNFDHGTDFYVSLKLDQEPKDSMVIATPFNENVKYFYYNRKIIGMRANGIAFFHNRNINFDSCESYGLLDWGRGIWPYKTTWYWSAAQGMIEGNLFGFNLGYGFGNTSAATENMLFFQGKANKLTDVTFHIPVNNKNEYDYMQPWHITSKDDRLKLTFTPILNRSANLSIILLSTNQNQVFGKFTGSAILDDDTVVYLNDFLGFAERVENRW